MFALNSFQKHTIIIHMNIHQNPPLHFHIPRYINIYTLPKSSTPTCTSTNTLSTFITYHIHPLLQCNIHQHFLHFISCQSFTATSTNTLSTFITYHNHPLLHPPTLFPPPLADSVACPHQAFQEYHSLQTQIHRSAF